MAATPGTIALQEPSAAFLDPGTRDISLPWRYYLRTLKARTGGNQGNGPAASQADLQAEIAARVAGDQVLTAGISAERGARVEQDTLEQRARVAQDQALFNQIITEARQRTEADALLVAITELCTRWADCNLGFLPTSDPGGGRPWIDGNVLKVGTAPGTTIGTEDAWTWRQEDNTGDWVWG